MLGGVIGPEKQGKREAPAPLPPHALPLPVVSMMVWPAALFAPSDQMMGLAPVPEKIRTGTATLDRRRVGARRGDVGRMGPGACPRFGALYGLARSASIVGEQAKKPEEPVGGWNS